MPQTNNRLILELERTIRETNHEVMAPALPGVTLDGLRPLLTLVATARADYLSALLGLTADADERHRLSPDRLETLRGLRLVYEELVAGAQALEHAVARGHLDVGPPSTTAATPV